MAQKYRLYDHIIWSSFRLLYLQAVYFFGILFAFAYSSMETYYITALLFAFDVLYEFGRVLWEKYRLNEALNCPRIRNEAYFCCIVSLFLVILCIVGICGGLVPPQNGVVHHIADWFILAGCPPIIVVIGIEFGLNVYDYMPAVRNANRRSQTVQSTLQKILDA